MDSVYKNQLLNAMFSTIGNNKNPSDIDKDSIFLLIQYIADNLPNSQELLIKLDNINGNLTAIKDFCQFVQNGDTVKIDIQSIRGNDVGFAMNGDAVLFTREA